METPPRQAFVASWTAALGVLACTLTLLLSACAPPDQPPSPLHPGIDTRLVTIAWELQEVTYRGENISFDSLKPYLVSFGWGGHLSTKANGCLPSGYYIRFQSENRYVLSAAPAPAAQCGEPMDTQRGQVGSALYRTNEFSFEGDRLVLSGDDARLVFAPGKKLPSFPSGERSANLYVWRWFEATDRERSVVVSALAPIEIHFSSDGLLYVEAGACLDGRYQISEQPDGSFAIAEVYLSIEGCGECGVAQAVWAMSTLEKVTGFTLEDGRWILSGPEVRIVLSPERPLYAQ